ncbi:O-antigen ligase family protein [Paractinoplanes hotanensis]|uniref:O-antigen ligase family protein n=1 Tax=Paractinoplanes hotanensis TaxID=2906497 RepID=A0ABT0YGI7_9ACTN|nr:O-antigen ligase family protein [Actinoplanes hotanensis]MCM4084870.1 O-antigen ligase family protein [Actinoplanes hotanensis]
MTVSLLHPDDLEPSLLARGTYASRRRFTYIDAAVLLGLMLCLLMLIPAKLIVPNMTDLGRPGLIIAVLLFAWWVLARFSPRLTMVGPQPLRWVVLLYLLSILASYAVGFLRGLTTMEANSADRAVLFTLAFIGVALVVADGMPNWSRLELVLKVFVGCAAFMAVVGLLQFVLWTDVTVYLMVPGLEPKGFVPGFEVRGSGIRVASTTMHYIEFSAVMATALPFAIHFARFAATRQARQIFFVLALLVAAGIPATVSRTGFLAAALALLVMVPVWTWRMRYNMLVLATLLLAGVTLVKPGLIETVWGLFTGASEDPSVTSRTDRYDMIYSYFVQRPWFGRGTGTWVSPQYQYLDNQWFAQALTTGIVGVAVLALVHITATALAVLAVRRASREVDKHLCAALASTQLIGIAVAFTFDSFSFTTYATILWLMVGGCAAVWRFTHPQRTVRTSAPRRFGQETGARSTVRS